MHDGQGNKIRKKNGEVMDKVFMDAMTFRRAALEDYLLERYVTHASLEDWPYREIGLGTLSSPGKWEESLPKSSFQMRQVSDLTKVWSVMKFFLPEEITCMPLQSEIVIQLSSLSRLVITYDPPTLQQNTAGLMLDLWCHKSVTRSLSQDLTASERLKPDVMGYEHVATRVLGFSIMDDGLPEPDAVMTAVTGISELLGKKLAIQQRTAISYMTKDGRPLLVGE